MNSNASGEGAERKAYPPKAQASGEPGGDCAFCCLVLTVYPTLTGMTSRDHETFRDHLKKVHGLTEDISP